MQGCSAAPSRGESTGAVFLLRPLTRREIERFIDRSHGLPLFYGPTGIVRHRPTVKRFEEQVVTVGRSEADFERACGAPERWNHSTVMHRGLDRRRRADSTSRVLVVEQHSGAVPAWRERRPA